MSQLTRCAAGLRHDEENKRLAMADSTVMPCLSIVCR
jgi:hypothetical protein